MKAVFNNDGVFQFLVDDDLDVSTNILFKIKQVTELPGPPERCIWVGDYETGKLMCVDTQEYLIYLSQDENYNNKVKIFESDQRDLCIKKILRQEYTIQRQLNIIRRALCKIVDDTDLHRMDKVINTILKTYNEAQEKFKTDPNYEYITVEQEDEYVNQLNNN